MLTDDNLKAVIEGIVYVAPEPVSFEAIVKILDGEERERVKAKLDELVADYAQNQHGVQIRQVAHGYKFSTKAEHHEILSRFVKSLKPLVRLSKPALETLAVIAYRQPVTVPEIDEIRGVDSGGVIHTLMEKKLVVTAGRKTVVGRPILYRTSREFLVHFGLKDVGELPSLKEFEELAKRALGEEIQSEVRIPDSEAGGPMSEAPVDESEVRNPRSEVADAEPRTQSPELEPPQTPIQESTEVTTAAGEGASERSGAAEAQTHTPPPLESSEESQQQTTPVQPAAATEQTFSPAGPALESDIPDRDEPAGAD